MIGRWRAMHRDDICAILNIDRWELAQLIIDGKLPHRITARVLEQYIAAQLPDRPAVAS